MSGEYISREAAISAIRLVEVREPLVNIPEGILHDLKSIPAADVVEVVRCRECKYTEIWGGRLECHMHHDRIVHAEEYCAWGKRKDGGQDDV